MSQPPRYTLALDLATSLGWALAENHRIVASGVEDFKLSKHELEGQRLSKFYNFMQKFIEAGVHEVFYEHVIGFKGSTTRVFDDLHAILKLVCDNAGIKRQGINPASLKKQFTGSGLASKEEMCATAHSLGWRGGLEGTDRDHDECDAIAIIFCVMKERGYEATF